MKHATVHEKYCFAGQAAPSGYFANDVLPCICGANGRLNLALIDVAVPAIPLEQVSPQVHQMPLSA